MRCPGIAWPGHPRPSFGGARGGLRFVRLVPLVPTDGTCGCLTWSRGWLLCCSEPSSRDDPNGSWRMSRVVGCVITTFLVVQHPIFAEKLTDSKMTERRNRTQVDSMRCGRTNHYCTPGIHVTLLRPALSFLSGRCGRASQHKVFQNTTSFLDFKEY